MVELEVSSADKQGKDFTQVQGPRVEVTPLRPACLLLICEYDGYKDPGEMSISQGFGGSGVSLLVVWFDDPPSP